MGNRLGSARKSVDVSRAGGNVRKSPKVGPKETVKESDGQFKISEVSNHVEKHPKLMRYYKSMGKSSGVDILPGTHDNSGVYFTNYCYFFDEDEMCGARTLGCSLHPLATIMEENEESLVTPSEYYNISSFNEEDSPDPKQCSDPKGDLSSTLEDTDPSVTSLDSAAGPTLKKLDDVYMFTYFGNAVSCSSGELTRSEGTDHCCMSDLKENDSAIFSDSAIVSSPSIEGESKFFHGSDSKTEKDLLDELEKIRRENEKLNTQNKDLCREIGELKLVKDKLMNENSLNPRVKTLETELQHFKDALATLKADRKRLKAEKYDVLNQMKQLYGTLEDKEKELRDFIRNYEQRMKESDDSLRQLAAERDETEREKWNILKHARDEAERSLSLSAQLGLKEAQLVQIQEELREVKKKLSEYGYYSDQDSIASTNKCNGHGVYSTTTANGRLSSDRDSGMRGSSDRESTGPTGNLSDSTASQEGGPSISIDGRFADMDSASVYSAAPSHIYACIGPKDTLNVTPVTLAGLSRSAEHLYHIDPRISTMEKKKKPLRRPNSKGTWNSISRVFSRSKQRKSLDPNMYENSGHYDHIGDKRSSWSPHSSLCASPLSEEGYIEKIRLLEETSSVPMERWKAGTVLAWLEIALGMPQYGLHCAENVRSGKVLLELSDSELEVGLGMTNYMHRKKLRLAIEEHRNPSTVRYPKIGEMDHIWVTNEWLPDIGLVQYSETFSSQLVDGRILMCITKKELEKYLGVNRKFHLISILHAIQLLRMLGFDRQALGQRRRQSENYDTDPIIWSNQRFIKWARSIDLGEYSENLKDSGVHGALVVLEGSFTPETMATALGIPQSKSIIRRHLGTELEVLIRPARIAIDEEVRRIKAERRRSEKLLSGGSLGRNFSRSYASGLQERSVEVTKDSRDGSRQRSSLRGSLSRALGIKLHNDYSRFAERTPRTERPQSAVDLDKSRVEADKHRRIRSIGDIETMTVTPV